MKIIKILLIIILLVFYLSTNVLVAAIHQSPVTIISPINGWSGDRLVTLEATITDAKIKFANLIENGTQRMVRVRDSRVREKLVLSPGSNQIIVQVTDPKTGKIYSDNVVVYSKVPKKDIKIILTWDTDGTDIDLHVINPKEVDCCYSNPQTEEGGKLDVDITDGYGPEVFTQTNAARGVYKVKAHYYSSNGHPQTHVRLQVILFEGTDLEKIYRFDKVLTKTNDIFEIGTFNIESLGKH